MKSFPIFCNLFPAIGVFLSIQLNQHWKGEGANHTKKHPPINLMYCEYFEDVRVAFHREKQIQGWSHKKKKALIAHDHRTLKYLAQCKNKSPSSNYKKE